MGLFSKSKQSTTEGSGKSWIPGEIEFDSTDGNGSQDHNNSSTSALNHSAGFLAVDGGPQLFTSGGGVEQFGRGGAAAPRSSPQAAAVTQSTTTTSSSRGG